MSEKISSRTKNFKQTTKIIIFEDDREFGAHVSNIDKPTEGGEKGN